MMLVAVQVMREGMVRISCSNLHPGLDSPFVSLPNSLLIIVQHRHKEWIVSFRGSIRVQALDCVVRMLFNMVEDEDFPQSKVKCAWAGEI